MKQKHFVLKIFLGYSLKNSKCIFSNNQSINLRYVSQNVVQCPLAGFPEKNKVADMIKTRKVSIKKQQEDVNKLLEKIVAAIELSCGGRYACEVNSVRIRNNSLFQVAVAETSGTKKEMGQKCITLLN